MESGCVEAGGFTLATLSRLTLYTPACSCANPPWFPRRFVPGNQKSRNCVAASKDRPCSSHAAVGSHTRSSGPDVQREEGMGARVGKGADLGVVKATVL